ncbi:unnamed protein product [marine sediment metagenome]|uniref:Uncharacterized protein n=1 Tax=marine sediment metagenome TaxID=412755 RepID=X1FC99_9ZZZZ
MDSERLAEILDEIKFNVDVQVEGTNQGERGVHNHVSGGITLDPNIYFKTDAEGAQELKDLLEPMFREIGAAFMVEIKELNGQYPDDTWEIEELKAWIIKHTEWSKEDLDYTAEEHGKWTKAELLVIPELD